MQLFHRIIIIKKLFCFIQYNRSFSTIYLVVPVDLMRFAFIRGRIIQFDSYLLKSSVLEQPVNIAESILYWVSRKKNYTGCIKKKFTDEKHYLN